MSGVVNGLPATAGCHQINYSVSELTRIKDELDSRNIGANAASLAMRLAPPVRLTPEQRDAILHHRTRITELLNSTCMLYRRSLDDPSLAWVRDMVEGNTSARAKSLSREAALTPERNPPIAYRADLINWDSLAEVQWQGAGLGLQHAIGNIFSGLDVYGPSMLSRTYAAAIQAYTGKVNPSVLFLAHDYGLKEAKLFADVLAHVHGIRATVINTKLANGPVDPDINVIFWKGRLDDLITNPTYAPIFAKFSGPELHRKFVPPLTCLRLSKMNLLLPFLPQTRDAYSDDVRRLIPTTRILTPELADEIRSWSRSKRKKFVIKYAGQDFDLNWGAKGVLMLGRGDEDEKNIAETIKDPRLSPWLLQDRIRTKFNVRCLTADGTCENEKCNSARINPRYIQMDDGHLEFVGGLVMFSQNYKTHGGEETIVTAML